MDSSIDIYRGDSLDYVDGDYGDMQRASQAAQDACTSMASPAYLFEKGFSPRKGEIVIVSDRSGEYWRGVHLDQTADGMHRAARVLKDGVTWDIVTVTWAGFVGNPGKYDTYELVVEDES